ncbi:hypothetical protein [Streptomyces sp. NPDC096339]|uniref:hypothetical protein n=1 Tax=Streptomyces sp. NPDC096339 TaxID=3366086 RepID=UPI0038018E9A
MASARGMQQHRTVRRTAEGPATPWQDFDDLRDRMIDLFEAGRSPGRGHRGEADEEPGRNI